MTKSQGLIPATGAAKATVDQHSEESPITLFGSSFCPFVQRAWITLESTQTPYRYYEVDPYAKPDDLLEVNPRGLVPGLRIDGPESDFGLQKGQWLGMGESVVIMDLIEDLAEKRRRKTGGNIGKSLLPDLDDVYNRSLCRLHADYINRNIVPSFYRFLQAQEASKQAEYGSEFLGYLLHLISLFRSALESTSHATSQAPPKGLFYDNDSEISWVDVMIAPWIVRLDKVLKPYRGFDLKSLNDRDPEKVKGARKGEIEELRNYVSKVVQNELVARTTSDDQLYLDLYKRYAENHPGTSQVADAINSGKALP